MPCSQVGFILIVLGLFVAGLALREWVLYYDTLTRFVFEMPHLIIPSVWLLWWGAQLVVIDD